MQNTRLEIDFTEAEKTGLLKILKRFDTYEIANDLHAIIATTGTTVLAEGEALILAGLVRQYYPFWPSA